MPVNWFCDACGRQMSALNSISRDYGLCNYKDLCGGCASQMDAAALKVFDEIQASGKRPMRTPMDVFRQLLG